MNGTAQWWMLLGMLIIGLSLTATARAEVLESKPIVWTVGSLERVGPLDTPGQGQAVHLYAGRGEYESFQVIVRPSETDYPNLGGLQRVTLAASDLKRASGPSIASKNVTFYREHYVYLWQGSPTWQGPPNLPLGPGWYPDALIPFMDPQTGEDIKGAAIDGAPFDVPVKTNQPVWVDVFVPRDTVPGEYEGTVTVTSEQGTAEVKVALTVWNFTLPLKPSLKSAFLFWHEQDKAAYIELLRNRLMPFSVPPQHERELIDQWGLNCANLGIWSGASYGAKTMPPAPAPEKFEEAAAKHQPDLFLYNYSADEISGAPELLPTVKEWGRNTHRAKGKISHLVTMVPVPELLDDGLGKGRSAVDVWVVLPLQTRDEKGERLRDVLRKGDEVWSYAALAQDSYSPKWLLDYPLSQYRIWGFINWNLGYTGLLYWAVDKWPSDPWHNVSPRGNGGNRYAGDGMLMYPGEPVGVKGVCPSLRLKALRDAVEDYEYGKLLEARGLSDRARPVVERVAKDFAQWSGDPAAIEAARVELGQMLSESGGQ